MFRASATTRTIGPIAIGVLVVLALLLSACTDAPATRPEASSGIPELRVSAATSLKRAFERLAPGFEERSGARVVYNFGASGLLQKQIEGGAPADVFASASPRQVDALAAQGLVAGEAETFAGNELVIVVPSDGPNSVSGAEDLADLTRLATGNPETAPHGTTAREWLETVGLWDGLESRFVFAENAAQTVDFVARGEVDAGLVFSSEVRDATGVEVVYVVPADEITPIAYVIAPLTDATDPELAGAFIEYVLSDEGQRILEESGFEAAPGP